MLGSRFSDFGLEAITATMARTDAEAIAALYSDAVVYRSPAFREPDLG
jgi:hypothetical protein